MNDEEQRFFNSFTFRFQDGISVEKYLDKYVITIGFKKDNCHYFGHSGAGRQSFMIGDIGHIFNTGAHYLNSSVFIKETM